MSTHSNGTPSPLWILALLPVFLLLITLLETLRAPWDLLGDHFSLISLFPRSWGEIIAITLGSILWVLLIQPLILLGAFRARGRPKLLLMVSLAGGAATGWGIYSLMATYQRFATNLPAIAVVICVAAVLIFCIRETFSDAPESASTLIFRLLIGGGALLMTVLTLYGHHAWIPEYYQSLHLALVAMASTTAFWGAAVLLSTISHLPALRRGLMVTTVISAALLFALPMGALLFPLPPNARPYLLAATELYTVDTRLLFDEGDLSDSLECDELVGDQTRLDAWEDFLARAGLPRLDTAQVSGKNVLLVMIETIRFDQTGLADPTLDNTPTMKGLVDRGAFVFRHGTSSTSSTFQSTGAVMAMRHPVQSPLKIAADRHWQGELSDQGRLVSEILADAGYRTFRISHGWGFDYGIKGFSRGFTNDSVQPEFRQGDAELFYFGDQWLTDQTLDLLDETDADAPFFKWIFYSSPHAPYLTRTNEPHLPEIERYRQEIGNVDHHLGRLIEGLEQRGVMDDTILIVMGDHGEEFDDRNRSRHSRTLYVESVHVPLFVWIPGVEGATIDAPVAIHHVFPWLLRHFPDPVGQEVDAIAAAYLDPTLRVTDGAIGIELIRSDETLFSLLTEDYKIIRYLNSGLTKVFDRRNDPGETEDLFLADSDAVRDLTDRLERYIAVQRCLREAELVNP